MGGNKDREDSPFRLISLIDDKEKKEEFLTQYDSTDAKDIERTLYIKGIFSDCKQPGCAGHFTEKYVSKSEYDMPKESQNNRSRNYVAYKEIKSTITHEEHLLFSVIQYHIDQIVTLRSQCDQLAESNPAIQKLLEKMKNDKNSMMLTFRYQALAIYLQSKQTSDDLETLKQAFYDYSRDLDINIYMTMAVLGLAAITLISFICTIILACVALPIIFELLLPGPSILVLPVCLSVLAVPAFFTVVTPQFIFELLDRADSSLLSRSMGAVFFPDIKKAKTLDLNALDNQHNVRFIYPEKDGKQPSTLARHSIFMNGEFRALHALKPHLDNETLSESTMLKT